VTPELTLIDTLANATVPTPPVRIATTRKGNKVQLLSTSTQMGAAVWSDDQFGKDVIVKIDVGKPAASGEFDQEVPLGL